MALILNIETATTVCSVSLSQNGDLLFVKELDEGFTHAENLHLFINDALEKTGIRAAQLNAIAVSRGPGSYTGLRIGVSAAKGLAYALSIPLISVDTLQIMAAAACSQLKENIFYCPMIDARRMEVYTCVYDGQMAPQHAVEALIVDEDAVRKFEKYPRICFVGDGMPKCRTILSMGQNAVFIDQLKPSAREMVGFSYPKFLAGHFEDLAYFEPFYLKDFMLGKPKKR